MSHSFSQDALFPVAGQRRLRPTRPLTIIVPVRDRLEVNHGPSFNGDGLLRRSYSRLSQRRTMSPPVSQFFDSDTDDEWDNEDQVQYLTISPNSPFYRHPGARLLFSPEPGSNEAPSMSFSCDATRHEESDINRVAQLFHDELARIAPGFGESNFDQDCLKELGSELVTSPLRLFEDAFLQTLTKRANSALPPVRAPENNSSSEDSDSDEEEDRELYYGDTEDEDELEEDGNLPHASINIRYGLDIRLVAPFNEEDTENEDRDDEAVTPKFQFPLKFFRKKRH